jgi:hypothetical protein
VDDGCGGGGVTSGEDRAPPGFVALLIGDVAAAREQLVRIDTAASRRNLVRTTLAAIEGLVWTLKEAVHASTDALGELTPLASMALRERSYIVAENGDIIEQIRFITLRAMIRLICKQARLIVPDLNIRFDHDGWQKLKQAIALRNRITHPKSASDLIVSDHDLAIVSAGFSWISATVEYVLASTVLSQREFLVDQRALLERLKAGDAVALAAYRRAIASISE